MPIDPITIVATVERSPTETFDAFLSKVSHWWPLETHSVSPHLGQPAPETVVIERHEGGRIFETSTQGEQFIWGIVLEYVEGKRIAFSWHPGLSEAEATKVTVEFEVTDAGCTVVTLVHSGWEARGEKADEMRGNYQTGWADIIQNRFSSFMSSA